MITVIRYSHYEMRVAGTNAVYTYEVNPYVVRKALLAIKHGAEGRAWSLLRKYPCTKESIDAYLQRIKHATSAVPV